MLAVATTACGDHPVASFGGVFYSRGVSSSAAEHPNAGTESTSAPAVDQPADPTELADTSDDDEVLAAARAGDPDAFQELALPHTDTVRRLARSFAHTWEDADDMAQEALVRAFRAVRSFRGESAFSTWLLRVTRYTCMDWYRSKVGKARMRERGEPPDAAGSSGEFPERVLRQKRRIADVRSAIDTLDPKYRVPLVLYDLEGLTYEEVADVEGIPIGTVRSRLSRAREKLAAAIRELSTME